MWHYSLYRCRNFVILHCCSLFNIVLLWLFLVNAACVFVMAYLIYSYVSIIPKTSNEILHQMKLRLGEMRFTNPNTRQYLIMRMRTLNPIYFSMGLWQTKFLKVHYETTAGFFQTLVEFTTSGIFALKAAISSQAGTSGITVFFSRYNAIKDRL